MSTRSVIARPAGDSWEGRYHHFDGYPSGLGAELWELYRARYGGDVGWMRAELIDDHPAGWSSIVGADWTLPAGFREHDALEPCASCGRPNWEHYRQYYREALYNPSGRAAPEPPAGEPNPVLVLGHSAESVTRPRGPACYCHGDRSESAQLIRAEGDDGGTEWAYVLGDNALFVDERRWADDATHMVGMFGMGAEAGRGLWVLRGIFPWGGAEPEWERIESTAGAVV